MATIMVRTIWKFLRIGSQFHLSVPTLTRIPDPIRIGHVGKKVQGQNPLRKDLLPLRWRITQGKESSVNDVTLPSIMTDQFLTLKHLGTSLFWHCGLDLGLAQY